MTDLRYPVGKFTCENNPTNAQRSTSIRQIAEAPAALRTAVTGLIDSQLDVPYRPGGWTVRQVVHHVADSHLNAYIRFKWTLTEENPTIKPYNQDAWSKLADTSLTPVAVSLDVLEAIHTRFVVLLKSLKEVDWARPFVHPENGPMTLDMLLQLYAWHGRHHIAHITGLREREGF